MALTLLLGFAAVNTGNNLLFLIVSVMLAFMATSGVVGWYNLKKLVIEIEAPDEIYDRKNTLLTLKLSNTKRLMPSFLLRVAVCGRSCVFGYIEPSSTAKDSFVICFDHRGSHVIDRAEVYSPFPVSFFVRCRIIPIHKPCVVFPAPIWSPQAADIHDGKKTGDMELVLKGYEGDVNLIRDYSGGDPLKLIHWRLSAKHSLLKVKEMSATAGEPMVIDPDKLPGGDLEARLASAAYLINLLIRNNRPVGLKLGDRVIEANISNFHRLRLLTELALL